MKSVPIRWVKTSKVLQEYIFGTIWRYLLFIHCKLLSVESKDQQIFSLKIIEKLVENCVKEFAFVLTLWENKLVELITLISKNSLIKRWLIFITIQTLLKFHLKETLRRASLSLGKYLKVKERRKKITQFLFKKVTKFHEYQSLAIRLLIMKLIGVQNCIKGKIQKIK